MKTYLHTKLLKSLSYNIHTGHVGANLYIFVTTWYPAQTTTII